MATVTLTSLTKEFGDVVAVDDVSLDVADGEFITFVGPSGCGKTTCLRMIAGFESPTSGTVTVDQEDITDSPPYDRDVGMVFQSFALFPHMTVGENIAYGLEESTDLSSDEIGDKVNDLLDVIQMPGIEDRMPDELSGGQQQRVALARALAIEPDVLLLDEPLASLDKKLREQMQVELRRIHDELDITTIFVTHNQREAMSMSDRIAVIDDGRIVQTGTPEEVYRRPAIPFVADFIGTSNVFDSTVTDDGTDCTSVALNGSIELTVDGETRTVGETVTASFRPESVEIAYPSDDRWNRNSFGATVDVVQFFGDAVEYRLRVDGTDIEVVAQVPDDDGDRTEFDDGDTVTVHVPPSAIQLFAGE